MIKIMIADDEEYEREILNGIVSNEFQNEVQTRLAVNGREAVTIATLLFNFI